MTTFFIISTHTQRARARRRGGEYLMAFAITLGAHIVLAPSPHERAGCVPRAFFTRIARLSIVHTRTHTHTILNKSANPHETLVTRACAKTDPNYTRDRARPARREAQRSCAQTAAPANKHLFSVWWCYDGTIAAAACLIFPTLVRHPYK